MPKFVKILFILSCISSAFKIFTKFDIITALFTVAFLVLFYKIIAFSLKIKTKNAKWQPLAKGISFFLLSATIISFGVTLAFLSRFYFDQKAADLSDDISGTQVLIRNTGGQTAKANLAKLEGQRQTYQNIVPNVVMPITILLTSPLLIVLAKSMRFTKPILVSLIVLLVYYALIFGLSPLLAKYTAT